MKIFPSSLLRIAGAPFDDLDTLQINSDLIAEFYDTMTNYEELKQKAIDELFMLIGTLNNADHQNLLLNLKRDIFNDRLKKDQELNHLLPLLSEHIQNFILEIVSLKRTLEDCESVFESVYAEQNGRIRGQFKKMIQEPTLQKGLLLSSKSLLKRIPSYLEKNPNQFSRNDFKAELGLLKYLTRNKTKTSPFSTFTNLAIVSHTSNRKKISFDKNEMTAISHIRLNNAMFIYLRSLLILHPAIYPWFRVSLNPTIYLQEETFIFLTNHYNIESFQRISFTPLLGFIVEILDNQINHSIRFQGLVDKLGEHVEASQEELSQYLNRLIEFGFIEFDLGVSGLDPDWDLKLRDNLFPLQEKNIPLIAELRQTLIEIRYAANAFENAELSERKSLLKEVYDRFKSFCIKLHDGVGLPEEERMEEKDLQEIKRNTAEKERLENEKRLDRDQNADTKKDELFKKKNSTRFRFKPETIFYEDTTLNTKLNVNRSSVEAIIKSMDNLLQFMQPFKGWGQEKKKMVDYFIDQYDKEVTVTLLKFYEDYFRDIKKPEAEKKKKQREDDEEKKSQNKGNRDSEDDRNNKFSNPFKEESLVKRWKKNAKTLFESTDILQNDIVQLDQNHLKEITAESDINTKPFERISFGMFIQFFIEEDKFGKNQLKGVVNGVFPGFGRMMSRFLHLFDEDLTEELRSWNRGLELDDMLVENCDASYHNANIHPPLMPSEIRMPGSQNTLPAEKQILITNLLIQEKNGQLYLSNRRNSKTIYTFDLGFQGFKGHSELFQLLSQFTLAKFISPHGLISVVNEHIFNKTENEGNRKKKTDIVVYPRIEYDNKLVLQRKWWSIPVKKLPFQNKNESDSNYFLRVNQWRKSHSIPNKVFIKIFQRAEKNMSTNEKNKVRVGRDDYKPQYVDFNNPLLVILFAKLVKKVPVSMKIEEMLPHSDQLLRVGDQKFVTEHMVQWYHF